MPRKDPTFTDQDLLRFYCRNLDQTEKFSVHYHFQRFFTGKIKICPDDEFAVDPCPWIFYAHEVIYYSGRWLKYSAFVIGALVSIEVMIKGMSLVGPAGRLLSILLIAIGFLIQFLLAASIIVAAIWGMGQFITGLNHFFCKGERMTTLEPPPNWNPPEGWDRNIDKVMQVFDDIMDWLGDSGGDLPPDTFPPGVFP